MLAGCVRGNYAAGLVLFFQSTGSESVTIIIQKLCRPYTDIAIDTWFLVGMAARLALGLGLHSSLTYNEVPEDIAQSRKRLFFSVYMMDRSV